GSSRSLLIATINESIHRPILLVTHQLIQAQQLYDDLLEFTQNKDVFLYPVNELIASEIAVASPELKSQRLESLTKWLSSKSGILVAPVAALKRMLPPKSYWKQYQLKFVYGEDIDIDKYLSSLVEMGYERSSMVTTPGEFSRRGGIIDIYPMTEENPIRIELFDDEIDSIRYFNADTQRSIKTLKEIVVGPATEILLTKEDMVASSARIEKSLAETLKKMRSSDQKEKLVEVIDHDIDRLKNLERFREMYK